jgi:small subunit ribosomal protein S18
MLTKKPRRPRRMSRSAPRRRIDINADAIDFRNTELLRKFITERGKILPRRVTGMPARLHRKLNQAIKRARNALLLK